jgi:hypothetical protein
MFKLTNAKGAAALAPLAGRSQVGAPRPQSLVGNLLAGLLAGARWLAVGLAKELAARRAMRSLASLDDRMLRDIGLERGQIDHAVRQGREAARRVDEARADLFRWG